MNFSSKFSDQRGGDATLPINLRMMKKISIFVFILTIHIHRQLLNANLYIGKLCQSSLCQVSAQFHICWPALGPSSSWNLSSWWTLSLSSVYCHQTWTWAKNITQRTMQSRKCQNLDQQRNIFSISFHVASKSGRKSAWHREISSQNKWNCKVSRSYSDQRHLGVCRYHIATSMFALIAKLSVVNSLVDHRTDY